MPLSNSVLRRYTPPTCTLEIAAKSSPLSRLTGQSVMKDLRFELRFDDPRKPEDERVTIRGDRTELEVLCDAVSSYVQEFLDQSPTQLPLVLQTSDPTADSTPNQQRIRDSHTHSDAFVNDSAPVSAQAFETHPNKSDDSSPVGRLDSDPKRQTFEPWTHPTGIYLQPRGLLAHSLFLGRLATQESGPVVNLSVLQLFDLATALDEYAAEVVALPKLSSPRSLNKVPSPIVWKMAPPPWTRIAAVVLLTVGTTAAAAKFLYKPNTQKQATAPQATPQVTPSALSPLAQVPPAPTTPLPISPLPTPTELSSLTTSPTLLPPSAVTITPLPMSSSPSTLSLPPISSRRPTISIPPDPLSSTKTTISSKPGSSALSPGGIALLPSQTRGVSQSSSRSSIESSRSSTDSSRSSTAKTPTEQKTASTMATPLPLPMLPSLKPIPAPTPEVAANIAPLPDTGSATPLPAPSQSPSARVAAKPSTNTQSPSARVAAKPDTNTLFDNIPQVAEVRDYLQQRWKPPASLSQNPEYYVFLNTDGTIQRIQPLNTAAVENLERSNLPMPGDPFVSPVKGEGNPKIRVVLNQDGKVQTFLEK